jgi:hypothetical protein
MQRVSGRAAGTRACRACLPACLRGLSCVVQRRISWQAGQPRIVFLQPPASSLQPTPWRLHPSKHLTPLTHKTTHGWRRWHLWEKHAYVNGHPVPGALWDFGLYFYHNAAELLRRGSGPYYYLPKMQVGGWVGGMGKWQ